MNDISRNDLRRKLLLALDDLEEEILLAREQVNSSQLLIDLAKIRDDFFVRLEKKEYYPLDESKQILGEFRIVCLALINRMQEMGV